MAEKFDPAHWHKLESPEHLAVLPPAVVVDHLHLSGAETVVDFGAGTGAYTIAVAEALPAGRVIAVDNSPELLSHLETKLALPENKRLNERIRVVHTQGSPMPLADGAAARVLAVNVLHHIHDEPQTLSDIVRVLAPGGSLAVFEFGRMERPLGPPENHVLEHTEVRALIAGLGLRETLYREPGEIVPYHLVLIAEKPPA